MILGHCTTGWRPLPVLLVLVGWSVAMTLAATAGLAQEAFRITYEQGRTVIDDPWRAIDPGRYTIDHTAGVLYVNDLVPIPEGLVRRGTGGLDERIGPSPSESSDPQVETVDELRALLESVIGTRLACAEHSAFVLPGPATGADSIFVYSRSGLEGGLSVPPELLDAPTRAMHGRLDLLADDGRGNLVLLGRDHFGEVPGALMDPESRCYALVRNPRLQLYRQFVGIHSDSALVFHWDHEEEIRNGERIVHVHDHANRISLHPLESLGGAEPCPRILPSVLRTQASRAGAG